MKRLVLFFILISPSIYASIIIGSPKVEINSQGLYLIQIKLTSTLNIIEDDIFIANFKSDEELSDFNFEFTIFENLQDYKRLTLAIPKSYSEDYISFRLDIKKELKKDIFIFLPQNNFSSQEKSQVSFKLPAKKIYGEPQRYDIANILSEDSNYEDSELNEPNAFSLAKPIHYNNESLQDFKSIPSSEVETIWSVSKSVRQNYDASIYQIMWGFYLENPNAFIDDNIHMVRGDIDLTLPSQELVALTSDSIVRESVALMETRKNQIQRSPMKPVLKLTAPEEIFTDLSIQNDSIKSSASKLQIDPIIEMDNSQLNASEIVSKNTSIIELKSQTDLSQQSNTLNDSQVFELKDLFWVGLFSLLSGFAIAYLFIRSSKKTSFTDEAIEKDLQDDDNTFQTNLSINNDIETQELDLVRTYIEMDDRESAEKILNKLISKSKNNLIVSEAQLLLKEKK